MQETILITGGAGFIGSNFINIILEQEQNLNIFNIDALTYAGNLENLKSIENHPNYSFVHASICDKEIVRKICIDNNVSGIINFAAESHVDRSILDAKPFIDTNITGTLVLLEVALELGIKRYLQVSTDEVYGSLGDTGKFTEATPITPNSPYSASKAGADHLVMAFFNTYNLPTLITRCSNNYGKFQFPEKLIPLMILNAIENKQLPVYGDGMNVRDWIHVSDHCSGIWKVYKEGVIGEVYNLGGNCEKPNIEIVKSILSYLDKPDTLIKYIKDRPGHDRRYAMDISKAKNQLNWEPEIDFNSGLERTIKWYLDNPEWCNNVRSGTYRDYYQKQYESK